MQCPIQMKTNGADSIFRKRYVGGEHQDAMQSCI